MFLPIQAVRTFFSRTIIKVSLITIASALLISIIMLFAFRNAILKNQAERKIKAFNMKYKAVLHVGSIRLKGLNIVEVRDISLTPYNSRTLFKSEEIHANLRIWRLFTRHISFRKIELKNTEINVIRNDSVNNFSFLIDKQPIATVDTIRQTDYAVRISRLLNAVFDKIPSNLYILNLAINASIDSYYLSMYSRDFKIAGKHFRSLITIKEDSTVNNWFVESSINNFKRIIDFKLFSADEEKVRIPFIKYKLNAIFEVDTARFVFSEKVYSDNKVGLTGLGYFSGLVINHKKISSEDVVFDHFRIFYRVNVGKDYFELDSSSVITVNKLEFSPYINVRMYPSRQLTLKINKERFRAQDLFESLPEGLFYNLKGIKTEGDISYHLHFFIDSKLPDSLKFESEIKQYDFRIVHFGRTALTKINDSFLYTVYDYGVPVRSFIVGPQNPNYRSLDDISEYLKAAVIISEDGAFYYDRGFRPDAIRRAIALNIKKKRFVQGASTITMQMVKNVFLNRNKTVARKLEEVLITWLIEYNGLCSKERIFEVYLNIVEWGPGIYGVNEAARFYFNKDASSIKLNEAIFLSNILPRPKTFRYLFDEDRHLKDFLEGYYDIVSELMVKRGVITEQEKDDLYPDVTLKGPAMNMILVKQDTSKIDSFEFEEVF